MNPVIIIPKYSLEPILILYFLGLELSNGLLSSGFPTKISYVFLTSSEAETAQWVEQLDYLMEHPEFDSWQDKYIFVFSIKSRPALRFSQSPT
jgi:hypothetical protein